MTRLFIKITRESLPQVKDKYPFIYLERGRLEVDDSSIKWIDSEGNVIRLPVASLNSILLGPGTTVTHDAIKTIATSNCGLCWVGEDSMRFYAAGFNPTATSKNFRKQMKLAAGKTSSLSVARAMFQRRFPDEDVSQKTLKQLMGMEGFRVEQLYANKAEQYGVGWKGRRYTVGKFELGSTTEKVMIAANQYLYSILCSSIHAMGYSPHIGFIHSGSPLPFVYDMSDLYKADLTIDLAFYLTRKMAGQYDRKIVEKAFSERVIEMDLLKKIATDLNDLMGTESC